uniref:C2H2-type domain-containing protein n=1 Tax=Plectus sambesii TaxID=2011161 RepID=A0A914V7Q4_9BILA
MLSCRWKGCSETSEDVNELREHISSTHLDYFPFRCQSCKVYFPSRAQVEYHWSMEHSGDPLVGCCLNRSKEKTLNKFLASRQDSYSAAPHSGSVTPKCESVDFEESISQRPLHADAREEVTSWMYVSEMNTGNGLVGSRTPHLEASESGESPSCSSARFDDQGQRFLPAHLIDSVWDALENRKALDNADVSARFNFFVGQLASIIPGIDVMEARDSFKNVQRLYAMELISDQDWPAQEVLTVALDRFRLELPSKELDRIKIIRSAIGHARKLIYSNDLRKRRQSIPDSSTSASPPVATAGNSKKSRTEH